jgi:hypothetical protein
MDGYGVCFVVFYNVCLMLREKITAILSQRQTGEIPVMDALAPEHVVIEAPYRQWKSFP